MRGYYMSKPIGNTNKDEVDYLYEQICRKYGIDVPDSRSECGNGNDPKQQRPPKEPSDGPPARAVRRL